MPELVIEGWTVLWTFNRIRRTVVLRLTRGTEMDVLESRALGETEGARDVVIDAIDAMIGVSETLRPNRAVNRGRLIMHAREYFKANGYPWESMQ